MAGRMVTLNKPVGLAPPTQLSQPVPQALPSTDTMFAGLAPSLYQGQDPMAMQRVQQSMAKKSSQFGTAGQLIGQGVGGPVGGAIGGALGSALGSMLGGKQQKRKLEMENAIAGLGLDPTNPNAKNLYYAMMGIPVNTVGGMTSGLRVVGGSGRSGPTKATPVGLNELLNQYNLSQSARINAGGMPMFNQLGPASGQMPQQFAMSGPSTLGPNPTQAPGYQGLGWAPRTSNPFAALAAQLRNRAG